MVSYTFLYWLPKYIAAMNMVHTLVHWTVLCTTELYMYLDERRGVQKNTSMRLREFLRAQTKVTPETKHWYFPLLPDLSQDTEII